MIGRIAVGSIAAGGLAGWQVGNLANKFGEADGFQDKEWISTGIMTGLGVGAGALVGAGTGAIAGGGLGLRAPGVAVDPVVQSFSRSGALAGALIVGASAFAFMAAMNATD